MDRPIWYLVPGGVPTKLEAKAKSKSKATSLPRDAAWWCYEGDEGWSPVDPRAAEPTIAGRDGWTTRHLVSRFGSDRAGSGGRLVKPRAGAKP